MTPADFVLFDGDSSPDTPIIKIHEALKKPIVISDGENSYTVLSYYYSKGRMVLDIERE